MIDNDDIAEIYEALGDPRAPLARALAEDERRADDEWHRASSETLDAVADVLYQVEHQDKLKHNDTCWKQHAVCLADRLRELIGE